MAEQDDDFVADDTSNSDDQSGADEQSDEAQDNDTVTVDAQTFRKMQSEKDRNLNKAKDLENEVADLRETIQRDKFITKFLKENSEEYPDVEAEDLESATDVSEVKALAKKAQARYEEIEKRALQKLQDVPTGPQMSETDKRQKVQELSERASKGEDVFDEWLELTDKSSI